MKCAMVKKVCMLGDKAVGKTALVRRYVLDIFDDSYLTTLGTKVVKRTEENVAAPAMAAYEKIDLSMMIWDINHKFLHPSTNDPMIHSYVQGGQGAIFVVDSTSKKSLDVIDKQIKIVYEKNGWVPMVFIANKKDIFDQVKRRAEGKSIDVKLLKNYVAKSVDGLLDLEKKEYLNRLCEAIRSVDPDDMVYPDELEEISKLADKQNYTAPHVYASALLGRNVKNAFRSLADTLVNAH